MGDMKTEDEFTGDPAGALAVTGTGGCCGNAAGNAAGNATRAAEPVGVVADPCCGTAAGAQAAGSCCAPAAKAEAVASGTGCCG